MHGLAMALFGIALQIDPLVLPSDVSEMRTPVFALPIHSDAFCKDKIESLRVFVSRDIGKTWKHHQTCKHLEDYRSNEAFVFFTAPKDGLYCCALQVVYKSGNTYPAELDRLAPDRKVYVNTKQIPFKSQKSHKSREELQREVNELRITVQQLRRQIQEMEPDLIQKDRK